MVGLPEAWCGQQCSSESKPSTLRITVLVVELGLDRLAAPLCDATSSRVVRMASSCLYQYIFVGWWAASVRPSTNNSLCSSWVVMSWKQDIDRRRLRSYSRSDSPGPWVVIRSFEISARSTSDVHENKMLDLFPQLELCNTRAISYVCIFLSWTPF